LNVAITRAREKVIVVTSMPIREISDMLATGRKASKPRDYLQAYLDYASKLSDGMQVVDESRSLPPRREEFTNIGEDGFLNSVLEYIRSLGYKPSLTKNTTDAFKLDIVIEDPKTKLYGLGIECDSPQNELLKLASYREIWRSVVLSKSIPNIYRINCNDWYHNKESEQEALKNIIESSVGKL